VRSEREAYLGPDGKMVPAQRHLSADFSPDLRNDEDTALAKSTFTFRGLAIYENGQPVNPSYRISVFDSEVARLQNGWTEAEEALVVEELRERGPIGQMYVEVVPVPAERPWNGYDELTDASRIVELAIAIDADLEKVLQYERENRNRADVLQALQSAADAADETITVSA
jgi:hypothetical protein